MVRSGGRAGQAADAFEQAIEGGGTDDPAAWFGLGEARRRLGDRPGAARAWRRTIELDPSRRDDLEPRIEQLEASATS